MSTITSFQKFALGLKILENLVEENQSRDEYSPSILADSTSHSGYPPIFNTLQRVEPLSTTCSTDPIILGRSEDGLPIELDIYNNPIGSLLIIGKHVEDKNLFFRIFTSLLSQGVYLSHNLILITSQVGHVVSLQDHCDYMDVYHPLSKETKGILEDLAYTIEQRKYGRELDLPFLVFIEDIDSLLRTDDAETIAWLKYVITQGGKSGIQTIACSTAYPFENPWINLEGIFNWVIYSQDTLNNQTNDWRKERFFQHTRNQNQYLVEIDHDWVKFTIDY